MFGLNSSNMAPSSLRVQNTLLPSIPNTLMSQESFHVGYYVPAKVEPGDPYGGLEEIWTQCFKLLFQQFPHRWRFGPTEHPKDGWHIFRDMAKVRFACSKCHRGWTTMHGIVVFYYTWVISHGHGEVRFLLTGQNCNVCKSSEFQTPMWYPEETQKVMTNFYYEIGRKFYSMNTPPLIKNRRHGRPRQQHDTSKCEGCRLGICNFNKRISQEIASQPEASN